MPARSTPANPPVSAPTQPPTLTTEAPSRAYELGRLGVALEEAAAELGMGPLVFVASSAGGDYRRGQREARIRLMELLWTKAEAGRVGAVRALLAAVASANDGVDIEELQRQATCENLARMNAKASAKRRQR